MAHLSAPPVLSTPESHIFEDPTPVVDASSLPRLSEDEVYIRYEIDRTIKEIRKGRWTRIALQFPDEMVGDGVRVYQFLKRGLAQARKQEQGKSPTGQANGTAEEQRLEQSVARLSMSHQDGTEGLEEAEEQFNILADTSYGSCCVDEIAAEHVEAEVVVHYGRSCLSPTARLHVIYVFTTRDLDASLAVEAFKNTYPDKSQKVILMGDLPYHSHLSCLTQRLRAEGYEDILVPDVAHNPASLLPNRSLPNAVGESTDQLKVYALYHIGQPPPALLLTLSSRVLSIHIYDGGADPKACAATTTPLLRRRYALLTSLSTVSIFGILINTLSVKSYLTVVSHVQKLISTAGKKSYTFVVGKVNPAKVANFAEIGGWVVIGCWESSLVESKDFYKPLITPFELELALMNDKDRLWSGDWRSDFDAVLGEKVEVSNGFSENGEYVNRNEVNDEEEDGEDESAPPEFDLRTGRYVSHRRPMQTLNGNARPVEHSSESQLTEGSQSLLRRANGTLAQVGGVVSPGAEFLKSARSWKGLGSDYEIRYDEPGAQIEEGRSGVARGYGVGDAEHNPRH
jgi:diphthamide biosynthesis protein 2